VRDDQEIVFNIFQFDKDWLQPDAEIVVALSAWRTMTVRIAKKVLPF
jgi:hypothetical protein